MNQKGFAIFVGALMILSAFAGFVMRSGDTGQTNADTEAIETASLAEFGVQGRLVDWTFSKVEDVLEMCPEGTTHAYWVDLGRSANLTEVARAVLPPASGLLYGDTLYPTKVMKLAVARFNQSYVEFHWIKPFKVGYSGLMIPYDNFMIIPSGPDNFVAVGRPTLFGPQSSVEEILDVISGELATDRFTLTYDEYADLQVAGLGSRSGLDASIQPPLGGGYDEYYLGVSVTSNGYSVTSRYLMPDVNTENRLSAISAQYGLQLSHEPDVLVLSGNVGDDEGLRGLITALLAP